MEARRISGRARSTWAAIAAAFALTLGFGALAVPTANAAPSFVVYDEGDSPNPLNATNGLIFYKAADLGWEVGGEDGTTLSAITELSYTVASGTGYAPSFQLVSRFSDGVNTDKYARLVWEPYQNSAPDPKTGTYANVQGGLWWTNKIPGNGPGTQSDPQPLSFFDAGEGAGWTSLKIDAIDIHQGTTTESTSLVTNVSYNGDSVPLGDADNTPFDQADIDSAVSAYSATHHTADGTDLGASRALLSTTPTHGKTVGVTLQGSMGKATSRTYQWFLGGKAVSGATHSTYKVPSSAKGASVSVRVTGTYKYMVFGIHSNTVKAK